MTYSQTLEYLFTSLPVFEREGASAYKPGLERVMALNEHLQDPTKSFQVIHIAGTNGKGSVSHTIASILQCAGYRVGLFTSPHLKDFRERIKINGEMITEQEVVSFVNDHRQAMEQIGLSFFEMATGMAFDHFARHGVDVAVVEVGLGGRLDSTNIVSPILSVITNISIDHISYLGDNIESIAKEKAGIIKLNTPVVIGESNDQSDQVFIDKASKCSSEIVFADKHYSCTRFEQRTTHTSICVRELELELELLGDCQRKNIATVMASIDSLNRHTTLDIPNDAIIKGCRDVVNLTALHGRWERLAESPLTICDTAHNEAGISMVVEQLERQRFKQLYLVIGVASDKEVTHILELLPQNAHYIFTAAATPRAMKASQLAEIGASVGLRGEVVDCVCSAVERAQELATEDDMIFIGGSNFVVAEII